MDELVAEAVDELLLEAVDVVPERAELGRRRDDLVHVGDQHDVVTVQQSGWCSLDRSHHPRVVDRVVGDRDADEALASGRTVARLVVEDIDVTGFEELRVVPEPDREEHRLVVARS